MFETLLFLRTNKRFWDRKLILVAIQKTRSTGSTKVQQRMAEEEAEGDLEIVDNDD
jgi:hypothetical protein